ncbi:hypothetical protein NM688_g1030 [Phlebia brevispora]|uniref:Uncharacterized protein n=1 Tax=Phlebia brevispora TaxID=194682 RepID=A0ACC1TCF5_9APHY|nr:hypothetical protein NM688_g1030 [Phlebia brevispora]
MVNTLFNQLYIRHTALSLFSILKDMIHPTPRIDRLIGRIIDQGRLCLVEPLGQGSGGVVFRAVDTSSSTTGPKEYAVKCSIKGAEGSRPYIFQRREIHFHSAVSSHPNVVTLHRVVEEGRYLFLVLDYCPGGDMFKFLTERHTYCRNDELVKNVFLQLIDAVQACHSRGVFHRDIKPENIMCNEEGTVIRLGDFGLSTNSKASNNFGAGTTGYMSPECIGYNGGPDSYSPRSNDVWSLGIIFTSMISGHNPWKRAVMTDDCFRAFIRDPNFLRTMLPISKAANNILQRIFVSPPRRIRLARLRELVVQADTFFMSDDEIAEANVHVQSAAASYLGVQPSGSEDDAFSSVLIFDVANRICDRKEIVGGAEDVKKTQSLPSASPVTHLVPLPRGSRSRPTTLTAEVISDIESHRTTRTKRPLPPPQPMPSFGDLVKTVSPDDGGRQRKRWRSDFSGFFRRIMDRVCPLQDSKKVTLTTVLFMRLLTPTASRAQSSRYGETIDAGRLQLVEALGEGAYGVVFRAVEQLGATTSLFKSPKEYAVKVLHKAHGATSEGRCQSREIVLHKIASEHPNVLTLHQVIEDDWFIYLVLDYCPGGDLFGAVLERRMYCQNDALIKSVFVQILDAVQSCHEKGIYHRDLKPENVFVSKDGSKVFLGDFGLATDVERSSSFSCGSSYYMSPECIGEEFGFTPYSTPASDVWSLGMLLANLITGRNPWRKATTVDEHFHRYMADKDFLREVIPVSEAAADIFHKIFTFSSSERITIPELREEILSVKTFFPSESELAAVASRKKKGKVAEASCSPIAYVAPKVVVKEMDIGACIFLQDDPEDEEYLFDSPDPDAPIPDYAPTYPLPTTITLVEDGDLLFADALSNCTTPASSAPVTPADTLVGDPMDLGKVKDLEGDEEEEGSYFPAKNAIVSWIRPSLRRMIGLADL